MNSLELVVPPEQLSVLLLVCRGEKLELFIEDLTKSSVVFLQLSFFQFEILLKLESLLLEELQCFRVLLSLLLHKLLPLSFYLILTVPQLSLN
jgi:hypothetical protein